MPNVEVGGLRVPRRRPAAYDGAMPTDPHAAAASGSTRRDLTERMTGVDSAHENWELLRLVTDNVHDVISLLNVRTMRLDYVSPSVEKVRGVTPEKAMSEPVEAAFTPESYARLLEVMQGYVAAVEKEGVVTGSRAVEVDEVRTDGRVAKVELTGTAILDEERRVSHILGVSRDVTERVASESALRESEQRLRDLALSTADWIWEVDAEGKYVSCSERVSDVLGYAPEEVVGMTPSDFMVPGDAERLAPVFAGMIERREGCSELRNRNLHRDGREVVLLTTCVPVLDSAGALTGFRGVDKDVTEREQSTAMLVALLDASLAVSASIDYDEVLERVARAGGEALGSSACEVWECVPGSTRLRFLSRWGPDLGPEYAAACDGPVYQLDKYPGRVKALEAGAAVRLCRTDPDLDPVDAAAMDEFGEKTWLAVPLVHDGALLGVMTLVETETERDFAPHEIRLVQAIGEQAALAIGNARSHRREEERNRWLDALVEAGAQVASMLDSEELLLTVARLAADAVLASVACIYEYDAERDVMITRARFGPEGAGRDDPPGSVYPLGDFPEDRRALHGGQALIETLSDPSLGAQVRGLMETSGEKTLVSIRLRFGDEILGMLVLVETEAERVYSPDELHFLRSLGKQAAIAMHNANQHATIKAQAAVDGLTGLANHRTFHERLEQEVARANRYGMPLSLLLLDVDDFKAVNDTHGHVAGDEALRLLARVIAAEVRQNIDLPARYGGEEFAVILPNTPHDEAGDAPDGEDADPGARTREAATKVAERIRARVAGTPLAVGLDGSAVSLTVSIGVASYPAPAGDARELVDRADAALYLAKRGGKDRVC